MHHPSSTGASTSTCCPIPRQRAAASRTLPLLGCARADPPGLRAATQNSLCWSSNVQGCPGAHAEGTVPTRRPRVGSSCLCRERCKPSGVGKGRIPAWIIPPQHSQASPGCQTPPWSPWRCVGRGCSVPAEPRVSAAALVSWSRQDSSWGPAKTNPFVPVRISDWALQHPQSRGGGEDAQTRRSCPSLPVSLRSCGVRAPVGEHRVGRH